ncbi:MAG: hypothetical protein O2955_01370 [Planctomycetota bacterium]|nr:hypothetical protein [Planctomycetota bacterium]MDA1211132.1 hypothetical protein [Planctomycetota bacterium]
MRIRIAYSLARMGCVLLFVQWFAVTLWYHHSQNHPLDANDYEVEVLSVADFERLADRSHETVTLDDGRQRSKTPAWYDLTLPKYKAIDGGQNYILVTAKGTAHFAQRWRRDMLPMALVFVSIALLLKPLARDQRAKTGVSEKNVELLNAPIPNPSPLNAGVG